jgi:hypothetical protein
MRGSVSKKSTGRNIPLRSALEVERGARPGLLAIAGEQNFACWAGLGIYFNGWALASAARWMRGFEEMRRAIAAYRTTGAEAYVPYNLALLADRCRRANDAPQGRKQLDEALDRPWIALPGRIPGTARRSCSASMASCDSLFRDPTRPVPRPPLGARLRSLIAKTQKWPNYVPL